MRHQPFHVYSSKPGKETNEDPLPFMLAGVKIGSTYTWHLAPVLIISSSPATRRNWNRMGRAIGLNAGNFVRPPGSTSLSAAPQEFHVFPPKERDRAVPVTPLDDATSTAPLSNLMSLTCMAEILDQGHGIEGCIRNRTLEACRITYLSSNHFTKLPMSESLGQVQRGCDCPPGQAVL